MKISENTNVAMPIKNMVGIIIGVAMGIFAYTEVTARLTSLETSYTAPMRAVFMVWGADTSSVTTE